MDTKRGSEGDDVNVYAFRIGTPDYPIGIAGPFSSLEDAKTAAYERRCYDYRTGRVRRVTRDDVVEASQKIRSGISPEGW